MYVIGIFSIGFYVGSAFFPSLDYSYFANTPIKEIVSDIKEVPVQTNSGTSIEVVAKKSKDDVDVEIENKGAKILHKRKKIRNFVQNMISQTHINIKRDEL